MKKIIFTVINDLGYDQRMHRILNSLTRHGYECELVGRKLQTSVPLSSDFAFKTRRFKCFFNRGKLFYLEYNVKLLFFLLIQPFDIVCAIDLDTIMPALISSKIKNKKFVFDSHEYFQEVPEVISRPVTKKIWEKIAEIAIPKADVCYTVSESLCEIFENKYLRKFHLIRNLPVLENDDKIRQDQKGSKIIIYQGAVNEGRGLEMMVEAMKDIDALFWIIGDGDITQRVKSLIKKHHVSDKVKMTGYLEPTEFNELTKKAYIGYNVLENRGLSYYYSLSNKFFSYIHASIPSLSSNFPEYEKIVKKYKIGLICEPVKRDIIEKINLLLSNNVYYNEQKQNCLKAREYLNWQNEERRLYKIYDEI